MEDLKIEKELERRNSCIFNDEIKGTVYCSNQKAIIKYHLGQMYLWTTAPEDGENQSKTRGNFGSRIICTGCEYHTAY
jgi:hypothetical protein